MAEELAEDAPLTADEILRFGPCVESVVWHPIWLQERRAPIAVAAGRAKLGRVFDDDGVGKAVVIRPCVSRGRLIRGMHPIYTPRMLESSAGVFSGWPMYQDHLPPEVAAAAKRKGRSVKEIGGQVLESGWDREFAHEDDALYGYRPGAVLAEVWANPIVRQLVGNNPNALHTSINAWPTSGKPGVAPWNSGVKGMLIEGIRKQPQGSLDYVPRGGAGGRLLPLTEGEDPDTREWPEASWEENDRRLVVSLAESFYSAEPVSTPDFSKMKPQELRAWVQENAPQLVPALREDDGSSNGGGAAAERESRGEALTEADVRQMIADSTGSSTQRLEETEEQLTERFEQRLAEREEQRDLSVYAIELIEAAEGIPATWKGDLKARYRMRPEGAPETLKVEESEDAEGNTVSKRAALRQLVEADLTKIRALIAEAQGKPRVTGEGGKTDTGEGAPRETVREQRESFGDFMAGLGLAESADAAYERVGVPKADDDGGDD